MAAVGKLLWLQLHTHMVEAGLCLEHANGISGGARHCATQGNLLSVSCSQRLRATNLEWAGYSGALQARGELILIAPESLLVFTPHSC